MKLDSIYQKLIELGRKVFSNHSSNKPMNESTSSSWAPPSSFLIHETDEFKLVRSGKLIPMGCDVQKWLAITAKRLELLVTLVQVHGDKWVGKSGDVYLSLIPDMQPLLVNTPQPDPTPIVG